LQTFGYNGFLTPKPEGVFVTGALNSPHRHGPTRPSDLRDGASHTAALSEALLTAGPMGWSISGWEEYTSDPRRVLWSADTQLLQPCRLKQLAAFCGALDAAITDEAATSGRGWLVWGEWTAPGELVISGEPRTWGYDHLLPPNSSSCLLGSYYGTFSATSEHRGGVNVQFCDGRVDFVSSAVDIQVWRAMANRSQVADDEVVASLNCSGPIF
jgi:prepilin-type processing-associated H-X9-DG protein